MQLLLADLILATHALFVAFVILGLVAILPGRYWHWNWVRNCWFRVIHLLAIGIVIAESWLGLICPLTEWESRSREAAGGSAYSSSFVQHWLHEILFYDFAPWVFTVAYTVFGFLVVIAWLIVPPESMRNCNKRIRASNRQRNVAVFKSNEELFQATKDLIDSLERKEHSSEANILKDGLASLNGLTDGCALFLEAVQEVESRAAPVFTDSEKEVISHIHDAVYQAVYRRKRRAWRGK